MPAYGTNSIFLWPDREQDLEELFVARQHAIHPVVEQPVSLDQLQPITPRGWIHSDHPTHQIDSGRGKAAKNLAPITAVQVSNWMNRNARVGQLLQNRRSYRVGLYLTLPSNPRFEFLEEVLLNRLDLLSHSVDGKEPQAGNFQSITVAVCHDGACT